MALYKSTGNYSMHHLGVGTIVTDQVVELDETDVAVRSLEVEGKLLRASTDGAFPVRSSTVIRPCCGGS